MRFLKERQHVSSVGSYYTTVGPYREEEKLEDDVLVPFGNCEQPVFRQKTATYRTHYSSETEGEEERGENNILRRLMAWRTTTTDRRSMEEGSV